MRKKHGILLAAVSRDPADRNVVMAFHRFRDIKGAKASSEEVPALMKEIGVQGAPELWFGEDVEQTVYAV